MEVAAPSNIEDALPLIQAPTLVLHPRDYWMVPEDEAPKVAGAIPNARMVILNSDGHDFLGDSTEFVAAIRHFIDGLPPDETPWRL
jgi:pimeloyl-ACP methyl ester carboxylesterase